MRSFVLIGPDTCARVPPLTSLFLYYSVFACLFVRNRQQQLARVVVGLTRVKSQLGPLPFCYLIGRKTEV
jgi:hypothetical protein